MEKAIRRQVRKKKKEGLGETREEDREPWKALWGRRGGRTVVPWQWQLLSHMQHHARSHLKRLLSERIRCSQLEAAGPGPHLPKAEFASINPSVRSFLAPVEPAGGWLTQSRHRGLHQEREGEMFTWAAGPRSGRGC